jgi:hypothetical protein
VTAAAGGGTHGVDPPDGPAAPVRAAGGEPVSFPPTMNWESPPPMRRLIALVPTVLLAVALLLPVPAALAATSADAPGVVLAVEAEPGGEAPGLAPGDPDDTENPAAPEDYEAPFLWAASVGLVALAVLGLLLLVGLYYLLVYRPSRRSPSRS